MSRRVGSAARHVRGSTTIRRRHPVQLDSQPVGNTPQSGRRFGSIPDGYPDADPAGDCRKRSGRLRWWTAGLPRTGLRLAVPATGGSGWSRVENPPILARNIAGKRLFSSSASAHKRRLLADANLVKCSDAGFRGRPRRHCCCRVTCSRAISRQSPVR